MAIRIVRNDITKMNTEAIVNTANTEPIVSFGCDTAIYNAAGFDKLLAYRKENIGKIPFGQSFVTPSFDLNIKCIIHTVSPLYVDGQNGEDELLRNCYRSALKLAKENDISSISFPLISTGSFGYPKEEGLRIAIDEINAFLLTNEMDVYLVVFDEKSTEIGQKISADLKKYIDENYVEAALESEYSRENDESEELCDYALYDFSEIEMPSAPMATSSVEADYENRNLKDTPGRCNYKGKAPLSSGRTAKRVLSNMIESAIQAPRKRRPESVDDKVLLSNEVEESKKPEKYDIMKGSSDFESEEYVENLSKELKLRMAHMSDTFSQYLLFLIAQKDLKNSDVYNRALVDKKVFSKIKNNIDYHPQKITALCLCVGAMLNIDETKDLLARAGYALSPCDKMDLIFSYFIEHGIYDMVELDVILEEYGLPCIIE